MAADVTFFDIGAPRSPHPLTPPSNPRASGYAAPFFVTFNSGGGSVSQRIQVRHKSTSVKLPAGHSPNPISGEQRTASVPRRAEKWASVAMGQYESVVVLSHAEQSRRRSLQSMGASPASDLGCGRPPEIFQGISGITVPRCSNGAVLLYPAHPAGHPRANTPSFLSAGRVVMPEYNRLREFRKMARRRDLPARLAPAASAFNRPVPVAQNKQLMR